MTKTLHHSLKWQSDDKLPRTTFPNGITKLAKLQGHERTGVLLILLLILVIDYTHLFNEVYDEDTKKKLTKMVI